MGSKGSNTQTQSYSANPYISGAGTQALSMAQTAAQQPFAMPQQPVAGFSGDQGTAFQGVRDAQGSANPYFDTASNYMNQSASPISGGEIGNYLNPYANYVMGNLQEVFGQQQRNTTGQLTQAAGGVGADRIAVGQGELGRQQGLAAGQTMAGIYQQALGAAQQDRQRQQGAGYAFGQFGPAFQNAQLQGAGALLNTGGLQQQQSQAQLNSPYQQELARLQYPFQTANFLTGTVGGLAPAFGGTTTRTGPTPSPLSQIAGLGIAGAGAIGQGYQSGAFSGGKGSGTGSGGGNAYGNMSYTDFGNGGTQYPMFGAAEGGRVEQQPQMQMPYSFSANDMVPDTTLKPGGGERPWMSDAGGGGGGGGGGSGGAAKEKTDTEKYIDYGIKAARIAMMFANRGGAVGPYDMGRGYARGGVPEFDYGLPDSMGIPETALRDEGNINSDRFRLLGRGQPQEGFSLFGGGDRPASFDSRFGAGDTPPFMPAPSPIDTSLGDPPSPLSAGPPMARINQGFGAAQEAIDQGVMDPRGANQGTPMAAAQPAAGGVPMPMPRPMIPEDGAGGAGGDGGFRPPPAMRPPISPQEAAGYAGMGPLPFSPEKELDAGQKLARSPWLALIKAGLATAAGESPFPLVNLGKGGLKGVETLEEQRKEGREEESVNLRAKQLAQAAQFHLDQYNKIPMKDQADLKLREQANKNQELVRRAQADKDRYVVESRPDGWSVFDRQTNTSKFVPSDGSAPSGGSDSKSPIQTTTETSGPAPITRDFNKPQPIRIPDKVEKDPLLNGKNWQTVAAAQWKETLKQPSLDAAGAQKAVTKLDQIETSLNNLPKEGMLAPGAGFQERTAFVGWVDTLRRMAGMKEGSPEYLAAAQEVQKLNTQLGFELSRTLGAREAMQIVQQAIAAVPGGAMSPEGARRIIGGLRASLQRDIDRNEFMTAYSQKHVSPRMAQNYFDRMYPQEHYDKLKELYSTEKELKSNNELPKENTGRSYRVWANDKWNIVQWDNNKKAWGYKGLD